MLDESIVLRNREVMNKPEAVPVCEIAPTSNFVVPTRSVHQPAFSILFNLL